jgi:CheY-like chemotaxis protein
MSGKRQVRRNIFHCHLERESVPRPMRLRVLLVDDSEAADYIADRILTACPRVDVVATARDGLEAIEAVQRHRPDLVLMDVMMPQMNGLQAASQIRKRFPSTRIVLVSTDDFIGLREIVKSSGGDAFVPKSRLTQQYCDVLQELCGACREIAASES